MFVVSFAPMSVLLEKEQHGYDLKKVVKTHNMIYYLFSPKQHSHTEGFLP